MLTNDPVLGNRSITPFISYGLAVLIVGVAAALGWAFGQAFGPVPAYILFYPAMMLSALFGGVGPGLLATGLGALFADLMLLHPRGSLKIALLSDFVGLAVFCFNGVFISLIASRLRVMRADAESAQKYAESIVETIHQPLVVLTADLRVISANRSFYRNFRVKPNETVGRMLYDLGNRQWDIPALRELLERTFSMDTTIENFEVEHDFDAIGRRIMLLNSRPMNQKSNGLRLILLAIEDITVRKTLEREIKDFNNRLIFAHEQERRHISHELHDSLAANLAGIKMSLEEKFNSRSEGSSSSQITIEDIMSNLQRSIEELRRIMNNLHPSVLDDLGLFPAISWFCREFRSGYSGIRVEQKIAIQESEVPEFLNIVIFRILQEAFNNAAKHSKANLIRVSLAKEDGSIQLVIEDNGQGFDLAEKNSVKGTRGLGLLSMKERVDLSGGVFDIVSHPGEGTTIQARWPQATEPI